MISRTGPFSPAGHLCILAISVGGIRNLSDLRKGAEVIHWTVCRRMHPFDRVSLIFEATNILVEAHLPRVLLVVRFRPSETGQ
jgi:hypothetical protein